MNRDHRRRYIISVIFLGVVITIALIIVFVVRKAASDAASPTIAAIDQSRSSVTSMTTTAPMLDDCDAQACVLTDVRMADQLFTFWSFDSNVFDQQGRSNATAINKPLYFPEYAGAGQCILFNGIDQYAAAPFIPVNNRSFTIEMFILLNSFANDTMFTILSQCTNSSGTHQCLALAVKNTKLFFGFSNDYQLGTTTLVDNRWYHLGFVFDATSFRRKIYLDGRLISIQIASSAYPGESGDTLIGSSRDPLPSSTTFPGYMDSLSIYIDRAKSPCEILNDATLLSYFSWDSGSFTDNSPNQMQAWINGSPSIGPGYKNQGLILNSTNSYLTVYAYSILAFPNQPFSTSIWIQPTAWGGTVIHTSTRRTGDGNCCSLLGLTATGSPSTLIFTTAVAVSYLTASATVLPLNQWSHVVQTFSPQNGLRLFVNGTLCGHSIAATSYPGPKKKYLMVGSYAENGGGCQQRDIAGGQFSGGLDEFRIFNRDLSEEEICALASYTISQTSDFSTQHTLQ